MSKHDLKWCLEQALLTPNGSGLIATEFLYNGVALCKGIVAWLAQYENVEVVERAKKHPVPDILFKNGFRLLFRHGQHQGDSLRGIRSKTFTAAEIPFPPTAMPELLHTSRDPACEEVSFAFPDMAAFEWGFIVATAALIEAILKRKE